jgi:hypothetical protein
LVFLIPSVKTLNYFAIFQDESEKTHYSSNKCSFPHDSPTFPSPLKLLKATIARLNDDIFIRTRATSLLFRLDLLFSPPNYDFPRC